MLCEDFSKEMICEDLCKDLSEGMMSEDLSKYFSKEISNMETLEQYELQCYHISK